MTSYGQFCPVAKAMEILDERWTLLIVRELLLGSTKFSELRRGVPRMSPALLSRRLRSLARFGIIERHDDGKSISYTLTPAGKELWGVVESLSVWGVRWIGDLGDEDLDPHLLFWDMQRTLPIGSWPSGRTVLAVHFTDVQPKHSRWWLVVDRPELAGETAGGVDVCDADPGFEVDLTLDVGLRTLTSIWRGDISWPSALRGDQLAIAGPQELRRSLPQWLGQSIFAQIPRPDADASSVAREPVRRGVQVGGNAHQDVSGDVGQASRGPG